MIGKWQASAVYAIDCIPLPLIKKSTLELMASSARLHSIGNDGNRRASTAAKSLAVLPTIARGANADETANLNRENVVAWGLQIASMAGDRRLDSADRQFAQRVALLMLQKLMPNQAAIDQIDRTEDRRLFRDLAGIGSDDLLRMAGITPPELVKAARKRAAKVVDVTPGASQAAAAAEVRAAELAARPNDGSECYTPPYKP